MPEEYWRKHQPCTHVSYRKRFLLVPYNESDLPRAFFAFETYEYLPIDDNPPNNRGLIYISYLDSIRHINFGPEDNMGRRTGRTKLFRGTLDSYLRFMSRRGYTQAHLWCKSPAAANGVTSFIFEHTDMRNMSQDTLLKWYLDWISSSKVVELEQFQASRDLLNNVRTLYKEQHRPEDFQKHDGKLKTFAAESFPITPDMYPDFTKKYKETVKNKTHIRMKLTVSNPTEIFAEFRGYDTEIEGNWNRDNFFNAQQTAWHTPLEATHSLISLVHETRKGDYIGFCKNWEAETCSYKQCQLCLNASCCCAHGSDTTSSEQWECSECGYNEFTTHQLRKNSDVVCYLHLMDVEQLREYQTLVKQYIVRCQTRMFEKLTCVLDPTHHRFTGYDYESLKKENIADTLEQVGDPTAKEVLKQTLPIEELERLSKTFIDDGNHFWFRTRVHRFIKQLTLGPFRDGWKLALRPKKIKQILDTPFRFPATWMRHCWDCGESFQDLQNKSRNTVFVYVAKKTGVHLCVCHTCRSKHSLIPQSDSRQDSMIQSYTRRRATRRLKADVLAKLSFTTWQAVQERVFVTCLGCHERLPPAVYCYNSSSLNGRPAALEIIDANAHHCSLVCEKVRFFNIEGNHALELPNVPGTTAEGGDPTDIEGGAYCPRCLLRMRRLSGNPRQTIGNRNVLKKVWANLQSSDVHDIQTHMSHDIQVLYSELKQSAKTTA